MRQHIFNKIDPPPNTRILEVGSGTGAILEWLLEIGYKNLTGVDIDTPSLAYSKSIFHPPRLVQADGYQLPFEQAAFGLSLCHYLLLWTDNPQAILQEMTRVTETGGWVLALAEPDHQARVDYPPPLDALGTHQTQALTEQGIDVVMGRKLRSLFNYAGLKCVEVGILGAEWHSENQPPMDDTEWMMLMADLENRLTPQALAEFQEADQQARAEGQRILFIPTFYAIGRVP